MRGKMHVTLPVVDYNKVMQEVLQWTVTVARTMVDETLKRTPIWTGQLWSGVYEATQAFGASDGAWAKQYAAKINKNHIRVPLDGSDAHPMDYGLMIDGTNTLWSNAELAKYTTKIFGKMEFYFKALPSNSADHSDSNYAAENEYGNTGRGQIARPWFIVKRAIQAAMKNAPQLYFGSFKTRYMKTLTYDSE
jgi:hypothetical protein